MSGRQSELGALLREPSFRRIRRKTVKWVIFTLTLGFLSFATDLILPWLAGEPMEVMGALSRGEVLIISLALAAGGVGELIFDRKNNGLSTIAQGIFTGLSILVIALAAIGYGAVKLSGNGAPLSEILNAERVSSLSMIVFGASLFTSFACVVLSELES